VTDPLTHINQLFADALFQDMQRKRYGLKVCRAKVDADLADDLRNLYVRGEERKACGCTVETTSCSHASVTERINSL